jgi:hypothetical protein
VKFGGVGVASVFIIGSKDSLTKVLAPFASCGSLSNAIHRILTLSDLEFAGWILYTAIFLSAVTGLIFGIKSLARECLVKRREQRLVPVKGKHQHLEGRTRGTFRPGGPDLP